MNKKKLVSISILQSGIVIGVTYAAFGLIFSVIFIPMGLLAAFIPTPEGSGAESLAIPGIAMGAMGIFMPVIYGCMGFVSGAIGALIYNLVAKYTGGLELTFEDA